MGQSFSGILNMAGVIRTKQAPPCGGKYGSSKHGEPIFCDRGCQHQPTSYYITFRHKKLVIKLYRDRQGELMRSIDHARETLYDVRQRLRAGTFDRADYSRRPMSFSRYWDEYIERIKQDIRPSSLDKFKSIYNHHLAYFADMRLRDINDYEISQWWHCHMKPKGKKPKYLNDVLDLLKRVIRTAYEDRLVDELPRYGNTKPAKVAKPEIKWLDREEQLRVLLKIPEYDQPIYSFLMLTGCRVMEAAALAWPDLDWRRKTLTIRHTLDRHHQLGPVKDSDARTLPISPELEKLFKSIQTQKIVSLNGSVFMNNWGRTYSYEYLRSTWNQACEVAEVEQVALREGTRKSWTMQRVGKFDIYLLAKVLGHSDIETTRHYAEAQPDHLRALFD